MDANTLIGLAGVTAAILAAWLAFPTFRTERSNKQTIEFREERLDLTANRPLHTAEACSLYDARTLISGTRYLSPEQWRFIAPIPLDAVCVNFLDSRHRPPVSGASRYARRLLPMRVLGKPYERYVDAIAADEFIRPKLWWDGPSYDIQGLALRDGTLTLDCSVAQYFEMVDTCESLAHEYVVSKRKRRGRTSLAFRNELRDPFDFERRVFIPALPTLPLFRSVDGSVTFLMHARDQSAVASAGGFRHVIGGQFQPSSEHVLDMQKDADIWLTIVRELAEELLDYQDAGGHTGGRLAFDEPPFSQLNQLRATGALRVWILGLGLDPLSLWPDILTVALIDGDRFRTEFPILATCNPEGRIVGARSRGGVLEGFEFTEAVVDQLCEDRRTAPAATACLRLAWEHRAVLLG